METVATKAGSRVRGRHDKLQKGQDNILPCNSRIQDFRDLCQPSSNQLRGVSLAAIFFLDPTQTPSLY